MKKVTVIQGDITKLEVDAIVNAANTALAGGGGVDGAIHRAGGQKIMDECRAIRNRQGGCDVGEAVITSGGNLKAKYVIHTVGPVWHRGIKGEHRLLGNAYKNSLKLAVENRIKTVAFPNISTGVYGFPKARAAEVALHAVDDFLNSNDSIETIIFCCFDDDNYGIYQRLLKI